ncbi:hypothetical protein LXL04_033572 [Taraxacum kok-saghyz]
MSNPGKANHEDDIVRIWKSQFLKELRRIRLTHVIDKFVNDSEAGPLFILNFLVLYVSVMIEFPSMGTVNQSFLENIKLDVDVIRLDWCGFVLTCLNSARAMWNRLDDKCVFTGPVGFLLLFYLKFSKIDQGLEEMKTHPLLYWTTERLKQRELLEISRGRFRNVCVSAEVMDNIKSEHLNTNIRCITWYKQRAQGEWCSEEEKRRAIEFGDVDVLLERGLEKYPGSDAISELIRKRNLVFNEGVPDIPTDSTRGMHHTPNNNQHPEPDDNNRNAENAEYIDEMVCTPLTQLLTTDVFDVLKESALLSRGIQVQNEADEDTNQDVHSPPRRRSKRYINLTDKLRSPNFIRMIDPNSGLKAIKSRVSGMIFAGIRDPCILNHEEQRRNKESPSRLFVSCTLLANYVLDEQIGIEQRYHMFYNRMNEYLIIYQYHINFQQIDIVFFPIISNDHYYMIVFNLQKESCAIIDNIDRKKSNYNPYGNIPYDLDVLFELYLASVKHPKRSRMKRVIPAKFEMRQDVGDWDVNLKDEDEDSDDQHVQLDDLRRKYLTKMSTSDLNNLKASVYSYLPKYDELPLDKKMEMDTDKHLIGCRQE